VDTLDLPWVDTPIAVSCYWVHSCLHYISSTQLSCLHRHGVVTIQLTPEEADLYREVPVIYNQTTGLYIFPVRVSGRYLAPKVLTIVVFLAQ